MKKKWTKEKCLELALTCKIRYEFKKKSQSAYNACLKNNWLDEVCFHMKKRKMKDKNYWTKEKCHEEALKYTNRSDFGKGSSTAYVKSGKMGWKDELCDHMTSNGNKYNRCIYAIEFPDNNIYIGLTYNCERRLSQHLKDTKNNSIVLRHYKKTGLYPIIRQLTDYIDVNKAAKLESLKVKEYEDRGWVILNIAKCGNVGGKTIKWTFEKCEEEAKKYKYRNEFRINSPNAYSASRRNKWMNIICSHMKPKFNKWDYESCKTEAMKYKHRDEIKKKSSGSFSYAYRNGLLDLFFPKK